MSVVLSLWIVVHSADHFTAMILADKATPMHNQVFTLAPSPLEGVNSDVPHTCELAAQSEPALMKLIIMLYFKIQTKN